MASLSLIQMVYRLVHMVLLMSHVYHLNHLYQTIALNHMYQASINPFST
jgi:hypothetical protein